ncbi:MAG: guanitoxin biosynthesis MBL fold metallo-hydrolase GntH [Gammaproteobacteria bacterium]|nr:guanitoxin biosynthesis MBL fold metallo-hydrolase GntH [Gammaproteobacteria bacterium]
MTATKRVFVITSVIVAAVIAYSWGHSDGRAGKALGFAEVAFAAESSPGVSPVEARPRDVYYPNSEDLAEDEMRVIACGTGMPTTRAAQAAACFLVELGNGDKFIFDIGSGSAERISSLQIPYNYLDKVFIGHLHGDHFGSLGELFIGGALMGRQKPLRIWGPSGPVPELGTAYAVQKMKEMFTWDLAGRVGLTDARGYGVEVNEFDYTAENAVIYEHNGVTVRSFPAIHSLDGPVSFSLEWNGLKFVFGSDTYPNKWFLEYAKDADLVVHECFVAVPDLVTKMRFTPEQALVVGTQIHTAPEAFGKVMSQVQPRMAIAYHFFKDFDTTASVNDRIRTTYDGPLSLAEDFMVWNVTKDNIKVRMAVVEEHTWAPPLSGPAMPPGGDPDRKKFSEGTGVPVEALLYSDFISGGRWGGVDEVLREIYREASEVVGREFPYPERG